MNIIVNEGSIQRIITDEDCNKLVEKLKTEKYFCPNKWYIIQSPEVKTSFIIHK